MYAGEGTLLTPYAYNREIPYYMWDFDVLPIHFQWSILSLNSTRGTKWGKGEKLDTAAVKQLSQNHIDMVVLNTCRYSTALSQAHSRCFSVVCFFCTQHWKAGREGLGMRLDIRWKHHKAKYYIQVNCCCSCTQNTSHFRGQVAHCSEN